MRTNLTQISGRNGKMSWLVLEGKWQQQSQMTLDCSLLIASSMELPDTTTTM